MTAQLWLSGRRFGAGSHKGEAAEGLPKGRKVLQSGSQKKIPRETNFQFSWEKSLTKLGCVIT